MSDADFRRFRWRFVRRDWFLQRAENQALDRLKGKSWTVIRFARRQRETTRLAACFPKNQSNWMRYGSVN
jgi:hypothetical protein